MVILQELYNRTNAGREDQLFRQCHQSNIVFGGLLLFEWQWKAHATDADTLDGLGECASGESYGLDSSSK